MAFLITYFAWKIIPIWVTALANLLVVFLKMFLTSNLSIYLIKLSDEPISLGNVQFEPIMRELQVVVENVEYWLSEEEYLLLLV